MRTAAAALFIAAAVIAIGSVAAPASEAAASECSWQRHSQRVVKQVKRHGRLRRLVRRRHWWTCEPVTAAPAPDAEPAPAAEPAPPAPVAPEPEAEANRLGVRSLEYYFVLSRPTVRAGEVTVELNNQGEDPHNLNVEREGEGGEPLHIQETASLQRNVAHFELAPGTYRLWCSLPEHEEKGMQTTLIVE